MNAIMTGRLNLDRKLIAAENRLADRLGVTDKHRDLNVQVTQTKRGWRLVATDLRDGRNASELVEV